MEKEFSATLLFLLLKNERDSCMFLMTGHSHSLICLDGQDWCKSIEKTKWEWQRPAKWSLQAVRHGQKQKNLGMQQKERYILYTHIYAQCNDRVLSVCEFVLTNWPLLWWIAGNLLSNHSSLDVKMMTEQWRKQHQSIIYIKTSSESIH